MLAKKKAVLALIIQMKQVALTIQSGKPARGVTDIAIWTVVGVRIPTLVVLQDRVASGKAGQVQAGVLK